MARLNIDVGIEGNSATGDTLRTAMNKINDNFIEVFDDLSASGLGGRLTNETTNGDVVIQPNGTGIVEVDQLQITDDAITSLITNGDLTLSGNGTGGVKVSGVLNVDDGINITDNVITSSASNANLELTASGTGEVTTDTAFKLISDTPFLKIQRLDNANVPGIDFIGAAGTSGSKILFDGTSGTANELIFQTFTVAGGLAEAFRVQGGGAKVTGTLDVDGGISITDNTITSSASNADLELNASGSGTIVLENLKVGTGATVTTILDEDNMSSDSATALATQQSIKAYVDSEAGTGAFTFSGNTMTTASNADIEITPGGTGNVNLNGDTVRVGDNDADATITTQGTGDLTLSTNGGTNSGTILLRDGTNGDIILEPDGTGDVLLKGNRAGIGTVNQPDTLLHLKDTNAVITLQRTNDANTPGISFQQSGGNVRGVIKLDGTSGTSNEIFMQTYDGSTLAERFRVQHTGAKVTGTLNVDDGISITDNIITTSASNADLELDASGTGQVVANAAFKFNAGYIEKINTLTSSSTITVNCALASIHKVTLATNTEFNITNLPTGGTVTLIITQDGTGSRTATFGTDGSTAVKFPGGSSTLSTGANDIDVVTIVNDGTNFLGNCAKDYS